MSSIWRILLTVGSYLVMHVAGNILDPKSYDPKDVIVTDVAIIGGGAAGTYAAINLREMGQKVVLVEKKKHLGGHTNTYTDHTNNVTVDYGVQAYMNNTATLDFFAHFGVPLVNYGLLNITFEAADFNTGQPVQFAPSRDFSAWAAQLAKYPWLNSTWNVPLPVDPDLLLPFGDFLAKYNMTSSAFTLYFSANGLSNPLQQPTVNVMKMVNQAFLYQMSGGAVVTARHSNKEIYRKAAVELGSSALTKSKITAVSRPQSGPVSLAVKTGTGSKLIQASKLLITIPPTLHNLESFDLNMEELELFTQWKVFGYFTLLLNNTGLPSGVQYINVDNSPTAYHIPEHPSASQITSTRIPGAVYVYFRSPYDMKRKEVEKAAIKAIQNIQRARNLTQTTPTVLKYKSHTPFKLSVSADCIASGFYSNLYALQGKRNTWYSGAAFIDHNSGLIWEFTQSLLPQLVSH
ncbi:unnamed protein product [Penicillium salamii]|uniref:Amine oxidase domain-containing protein n=1 Tax=Penicillium salamii TaxID=1612424 RepID=A0A9W4NK55_9EURO|nr:unnamed protein product [Penicillium salamii]CAG7979775.1 unnamed protein product [Penicillium salamii]CAG8079221.1 unnamed protein product [Penicillium salamii]CAG8082837.1 unnamed protein product [Penicillium salamii]CAG8237324.1 unnamed protein product [Penicillium salamii]